MAPVSRQEVNFARLLGQCERLVSEAQQNGGKIEWRVEKVVLIQVLCFLFISQNRRFQNFASDLPTLSSLK